MIFKRLRITNWRQYRLLDLEFHDRLTVLTGANGAGKTTVLNLLSRHFGWSGTLVGTPRRQKNGLAFSPDYWTEDSRKAYDTWLLQGSTSIEEPLPPAAPQSGEQPIGELTYGDGRTASLTVAPVVQAQFNINIQNQQPQKGLHIPSHRPIYSYQPVQNIPTVPRKRDQAFATYSAMVRQRFDGGYNEHTPNYYMKETLIALAAFGYGNQVIESNSESLATFQGFESILRTVLPVSLGFERLAVRLPEVVLITRSGEFSLDAVSGGIASLIDLAWQVFMYASSEIPFAVTLDEPENHLHPELQRTVLGAFLTAFPNVQFICATHNPFIVTSVPDSQTYALRYGPDHKVVSERLTSLDRSGSSNETLRDVLGLPSSSPTWVEKVLRDTTEGLAGQELTPELVVQLQARLHESGLDRFIPTVLANLAKERLAK
jgi:AAA domain, putative AbiEii toxin, Type IV TA system/AAA domain